MLVFEGISYYNFKSQSFITIGTFDGVHIGHRKILKRLIDEAREKDGRSTLLTFFPHPRMVLQKDAGIKLLNTFDEKKVILEKMGLDSLVVHPFTKEFARMTAHDFVKNILVDTFKAKKIIIGYDHRFGRNRNANITDLKQFGDEYGFEVDEIPVQEIDAVSVSSTKIRKALLDGDVETANRYLGYKYMLAGKVVKGKGMGKVLGFPTANLAIAESYKLLPKNGVYAVRCEVDGQKTGGMMNIGTNPTFNGTERSIEVNLFDIDKDLYGKKLRVKLVSHIREEQKFDSLESLKAQLQKDKATATKIMLF